jgi:translation initiation factor IF-2
VRANKQARDAAERDGVEIRYYNIIYDLVDDVKAAMSGHALAGTSRDLPRQCRDPGGVQHHQGRQGRRLPVTEGKVERGAGVRLIRDSVVIHEGKLKTLKRFKDEVPKSMAARNAAWPSRTTRTSAQAT